MLHKLIKRLSFLIREAPGKNLKVILYSLAPASVSRKMKKNFFIENILENRGLLRWSKTDKKFEVGECIFFYHDALPTGDVISIHLSDDKFVRRNFLNNSQINLEGSYEQEGVQLEKGDVVVDAGANIGMFSILASKKVGPGGKVFAFEPIQETSEVLKQNIEVNSCLNTKIAQYALADSNQKVKFFVDKNRLVKSSKLETRIHTYTDIEEVDQITLDSYVEKNDIKDINFIKADIEGAERDFIKGAEMVLKRFKPKLAICTYHLPDDPEVIESLIKSFVPKYVIAQTETKIFAWMPDNK